jgi:P4 family phage/plasmid primase-like protien
MMGLCLVPEMKYNVAFFLFGPPGTGKSVYLDLLRKVVGDENCCAVPLARLGDKHSTWPLTERLVNIVGDLETDDGHGSLRHLEGTFKEITNGGLISCERKHKDVSEAQATARCVFATNSMPTFADRTEALWDRVRILPFNVRVRGHQDDDPDLRQKLASPASLQGIFRWALAGLGDLQTKQVFPEHPEGLTAKNKQRYKCDPERGYLEDHYELNSTSYVQVAAAYKKFYDWLHENGFNARTRTTFIESVHRVFGIEETRPKLSDGSQPRVFQGLAAKWDSTLPTQGNLHSY